MDGRTGRRAVGLCILIALLRPVSPSARLPAQQVAPNRATSYLFPTDVSDARAVWVNPAGLGIRREASVYVEGTVGDPGAKGQLRQVNAGFNSRGLAFGYQRDIFADGTRWNTYRLGLAGGSGGLAAGFDVTHYRGGGAKQVGWDLGTSYSMKAGLTLGLVFANIGQPTVHGLPQRLTFVPALTWRPKPLPSIALSTYARVTTDSVERYVFGATWRTTARWPLELVARLDTDGGLRRGAFALGISLGGDNRGGAVVTSPGDVSRIDAASLYFLASREPGTSRRR